MKRIYLTTTVLLLLIIGVQAQSKSNRIYDHFESKEGITQFTFSKVMIDAVNFFIDDENQNDEDNDSDRKVTGDLNKIKFIAYNSRNGTISNESFITKSIKLLPKSYIEYEPEDDDIDEDVRIFLLGKGKKFKECHIFFNGESNLSLVVSFYGDFKVEDVNKLKKKSREIYKI